MAVIAALVFIIIVVAAILGIVYYIFNALGLSAIAKNRGIKYAWLAWIPYANTYLLGRVGDEYNQRFQNRTTHYAVLLLVLQIATAVFGILLYVFALAQMIPLAMNASMYGQYFDPSLLDYSIYFAPFIVLYVLLLAASITMTVFQYIVLFRVYRWCSASYVALLVCSIIFPIIIPFVLFAIRNGLNPALAPAPQIQPPIRQQPPQSPDRPGPTMI